MNLYKALLLFAFFCSASVPALADGGLREGRWDFAMSYEVLGMEQFFLPYATSRCVSEKDPLPRIDRPGHQCTPSLHTRQGGRVTWVVDCSSERELVHGVGRLAYSGNNARGSVHVQILDAANQSPQTVVFSVIGRYAGPCGKAGGS